MAQKNLTLGKAIIFADIGECALEEGAIRKKA